jgi:hypothetical protein
MEGLILESIHLHFTVTSKILSLVPSDFHRGGKWVVCNRVSAEWLRAGLSIFRCFDVHAPKEEDTDPERKDYNILEGQNLCYYIM